MWGPMLPIKPLSKHRWYHLKREEGQTLVEFAFVAMLFLLLLFGIIEFSRALWTWNTIVQATRAGARYAVVEAPTADDAQVKKFVAYHDPSGASSQPVVPGFNETNVSVQYLMNDGSVSTNKSLADVVQISVNGYQFNFLVPLFGTGITLPGFSTTLPLEGLGAS